MKKSLKSIMIGAIALIVLGAAIYGGFLLVKALPKGDKENPPDSPLEKHTITAIPPPQNAADVYDGIAYAYENNPDTVAWLSIPNTDINNAVMQGDDNDYYLRRDENREHDVYGCYFLDYECSMGKREDFSQNTVIYGHSELTDNKDGKRFAQLYRFLDEDFAKQNPYIFLTTPNGEFVFEIFSVFYTDLSFDYIKVHITEEEKLQLAQNAAGLSVRDYGVTPELQDKLLTLSTCTAKFTEGEHRFVVMGRLLDEARGQELLDAAAS